MSVLEEDQQCPTVAPAWMSTFADLATLLMAFFVLIISQTRIAEPDEWKEIQNIFQQKFGLVTDSNGDAAPQAESLIAKNFRTTVTEKTVSERVMEQTTDQLPPDAARAISDLAGTYDTFSDIESLKKTFAKEVAAGQISMRADSGKIVVTVEDEYDDDKESDDDDNNDQGEIDTDQMELYAKIADVQAIVETEIQVEHVDMRRSVLRDDPDYAERIENQFQELKANLQSDIADGMASIEKIEDRIYIRLASEDAFESGFAELRSSARPLIQRVVDSLAGSQDRITISGHTDNVPIAFSDRFISNWDLSSARAASVADFVLSQNKLNPNNVRVYGFADTQPVTDNDTADGRAQNRRIDIMVGQ